MIILNWIDRVNLWVGRLVSYGIWIGAAVLVWEVVSRYVFGQPTIWAHGYTQRIFAAYFILIGAYTLLREGHVRVDILIANRTPRVRAMFDVLCFGMLLIWCLALAWEGWNFFQEALLWNEKDDSALAHPLWPVKLCMVVAAVLFSLQAASAFIRALVTALSPAPSQTQTQPEDRAQ
ncbi:TRAP transporter small permease subunit [Pseudooceanicola aestuarii]|uniref:TRAP transporter small permease subunit n=1 Tax=Pseudooceanicola aestuarii TaxID=2697319 RepID=UPI0013D5D75A|nr:TRAP transporter small permease subunit [Pseudooceanicola aestuarii]